MATKLNIDVPPSFESGQANHAQNLEETDSSSNNKPEVEHDALDETLKTKQLEETANLVSKIEKGCNRIGVDPKIAGGPQYLAMKGFLANQLVN